MKSKKFSRTKYLTRILSFENLLPSIIIFLAFVVSLQPKIFGVEFSQTNIILSLFGLLALDTLIQRIQRATLPGGYNVISLFSMFNDIPEPHNVVAVYPDEENGIVVNSYTDWEIMYSSFEHNNLEGSHPGFDTHMHSFIKLIVSKPIGVERGEV